MFDIKINTNKMKTEFKEIIFSTLESLIQKMNLNEGINLAISQRLTFEKWLQIGWFQLKSAFF